MSARADLCIVTIGVGDLSRSVAFYEALGWERTASSNEEIAWFRTPHSYLGLFGYEELAEDAKLPAEPERRSAGSRWRSAWRARRTPTRSTRLRWRRGHAS